VRKAVDQDLGAVAKFEPPDGRLLLAFENEVGVGVACMRRIGPDTAEIERVYVRPPTRRDGMARGMLDRLIAVARTAGYDRIRLDSQDFMTAAHSLCRSSGFVDIGSVLGERISHECKSHWAFMERELT